MRILELIRITPGKRHGWYETDSGFKVRKPLGWNGRRVEREAVETRTHKVSIAPSRRSFWQIIKELFKRFFRPSRKTNHTQQ